MKISVASNVMSNCLATRVVICASFMATLNNMLTGAVALYNKANNTNHTVSILKMDGTFALELECADPNGHSYQIIWWNGASIINKDVVTLYDGDLIVVNDECELHVIRSNVLDTDINNLASDIHEWANVVFPDRTPMQGMLKTFEELGELVKAPTDADEYADVLIMLMDLAVMNGVKDLATAIRVKMEINSKRTWGRSPMGTFHHIAAEGTAE